MTQALHQTALHVDPLQILLIVWALGCVAVLCRWMIRSARVHRMVRASSALAWPAPMPVVASSSPIGPGLVGLCAASAGPRLQTLPDPSDPL